MGTHDRSNHGQVLNPQSAGPANSVAAAIEQAIVERMGDASVEVAGAGGHFTIVVESSAFEGKTPLESHRLVYGAISHLMTGESAPVHAVDVLKTLSPR